LAYKEVISANKYRGIPEKDLRIWHQSRSFYEFISRFKRIPLIGTTAFALFDKIQRIPNFYPRRDLSRPSFQVKQVYRLIKKQNWGKDLIDYLNQSPKRPIITTFFVPAFMAELHKYEGDIYCLITDADFSRNWVALKPAMSKIKYLAPNYRVVDRLKLYGVKSENIFLTGFPLPKEALGGPKLSSLKFDLAERIYNLDTKKIYTSKYKGTIKKHLGSMPKKPKHPLTVMFAVGGAGAQREIGYEIMNSLKKKIKQKEVRVFLSAGIKKDVYHYFRDAMSECGLRGELGKSIKIVYDKSKNKYFEEFNKALRETDILWTKPSELCFYCALGIPIIMAPPIGSQEFFNQRWLEAIGAGMDQIDPQYTNEWLFDWVNSGWLAEAAMRGFLEAP
ncbi:MAG: hypothetical protein U9P90_04110, partial [Patescibacteria group bacterium]|nr:hypothetical protein [Patescibacteria group bacterium]